MTLMKKTEHNQGNTMKLHNIRSADGLKNHVSYRAESKLRWNGNGEYTTHGDCQSNCLQYLWRVGDCEPSGLEYLWRLCDSVSNCLQYLWRVGDCELVCL
jgi:hypothetical protein